MKKFIFALSMLAPMFVFGSDAHSNVETDILERTVNFLIFVAILYYLLADKLKNFFSERSDSIKKELDKVQETLKESEQKVADAKLEVENARKIASELVSAANSDVEAIKRKIEQTVDAEIANLSKNLDEKISLETKKVKREVVENVLNQLLSNENIAISESELANIIIKKVA